MALNPSPVVALNRAVALSRVAGVRAALEAIDRLETDPSLAQYGLLPSVKGQFLAEAGDRVEAAECFRRALALPCSEPARRFLSRRLTECQSGTP